MAHLHRTKTILPKLIIHLWWIIKICFSITAIKVFYLLTTILKKYQKLYLHGAMKFFNEIVQGCLSYFRIIKRLNPHSAECPGRFSGRDFLFKTAATNEFQGVKSTQGLKKVSNSLISVTAQFHAKLGLLMSWRDSCCHDNQSACEGQSDENPQHTSGPMTSVLHSQ